MIITTRELYYMIAIGIFGAFILLLWLIQIVKISKRNKYIKELEKVIENKIKLETKKIDVLQKKLNLELKKIENNQSKKTKTKLKIIKSKVKKTPVKNKERISDFSGLDDKIAQFESGLKKLKKEVKK